MPNTKLCNVTVYFSSNKKKRDFYHCICLNDVDFCNNIDSVKRHIYDKFGLDSLCITGVDFNYTEVFE